MSMNLTSIAEGAQKAISMFGYGVCLVTPRFVTKRVFYTGGLCTENQKGYALLGFYIIAALLLVRTCCKCVFSSRKVEPRRPAALDTADEKAQGAMDAFIKRNTLGR